MKGSKLAYLRMWNA